IQQDFAFRNDMHCPFAVCEERASRRPVGYDAVAEEFDVGGKLANRRWRLWARPVPATSRVDREDRVNLLSSECSSPLGRCLSDLTENNAAGKLVFSLSSLIDEIGAGAHRIGGEH